MDRRAALANLSADLDVALARLYCIHGFKASARVDVVDDRWVKVEITFGCYECKQTSSLPPGIDDVVAEVLSRHEVRLDESGLSELPSA